METRVLGVLRENLSEEEFDTAALAVCAFQRRWNRPYANFCATQPEPRHWREIPAVPQSAFKRAALSCVPPELVKKTFLTSGTTGETRGRHLFYNTQLYDAALLRGWDRLQTPPAALLVLAPSPEQAPQSSLNHMLGVLARERSAGPAFFLIEESGRIDRERFCAVMRTCFDAHRPVALLGTALAFLHIFELLDGTQFDRRRGSFAMETGGFKGSGREVEKVELYARFGATFEIAPERVFNEYGMTELSSQFYTRGLGQPHDGPPWLRALVIDPETEREVAVGEAGVLRIFDLANLNSVLAIQTQDLAVRLARGFELLGRDPAALPRGCSRAADERMCA